MSGVLWIISKFGIMKRFRFYSAIIVSLLVILLGYNIYCLVGLYHSISRQTAGLITQSLKDADLDEILNRVERYPEPDSIPDYQGKQLSQSRSIRGDTLYITVTDDCDSVLEVRRTPLSPGTNYSDIMVDEIGYGAHQTIDMVYPLRISDLDSLFRLSLSRKGIHPEVASVIRVSGTGEVTAGDAAIRYDNRLDSVSICYNIMSDERYVAYFSSPLGYIVRQMSGIIISAVGLIVVITIALCYLFHTVSKLRTIEEMKDDFVNNMTHELKTPIAIAYSANDALLNFDASNDSEKKEAYLKIANRQLKRLGELVENILAMSMERRKTMTLHRETFALLPFIEEIAAAQRTRREKIVNIDVRATQEDILINADRTHFGNVINNLIDNAIKYSGSKEDSLQPEGSVDIRIVVAPGSISVADNGIGIPAGSLPFIFNRFYRVPCGNRQDVRGYGIGLYYAREILARMGMEISVESKLGEGSEFTIKWQ